MRVGRNDAKPGSACRQLRHNVAAQVSSAADDENTIHFATSSMNLRRPAKYVCESSYSARWLPFGHKRKRPCLTAPAIISIERAARARLARTLHRDVDLLIEMRERAVYRG